MTIAIPLNAQPSSRVSEMLVAAVHNFRSWFQTPTAIDAATSAGGVDIWQLYRMAGSSDSVRPAVLVRLSEASPD